MTRAKKSISSVWTKAQRERNRKAPVIRTDSGREMELTTIQEYISKIGVTKCEPNMPNNLPSKDYFRPSIIANWRG